jgi:predicted AAA+ superfamily ATPase
VKRLLEDELKIALSQKIVLLSGPRQSGKTTISRHLYDSYDYLNYDAVEDRLILSEKSWDRRKQLVIFDEFLFPGIKAIQLVKNCSREKTFSNGLEIRSLIPWLVEFQLKT